MSCVDVLLAIVLTNDHPFVNRRSRLNEQAAARFQVVQGIRDGVAFAVDAIARVPVAAVDFPRHLGVLPDLGEQDLKELGVPLGDRKRIMRAIAKLTAPETKKTVASSLKPFVIGRIRRRPCAG